MFNYKKIYSILSLTLSVCLMTLIKVLRSRNADILPSNCKNLDTKIRKEV